MIIRDYIASVALGLSMINFIKSFMIKKEMGRFSLEKINDNNLNCDPQNVNDGYYVTNISGTFFNCISTVYDIKISGFKNYLDKNIVKNNKGNWINGIYVVNESSKLEFNFGYIIEEKKLNIQFEDKFGNIFSQIITATPIYVSSHKIKTPWNLTISDRKWLFLQSLKRFFK